MTLSKTLAGAAILALMAGTSPALAQAPAAPAAVSVPDSVVSPDVHADRTVTFRVYAPKATEVTLTGDWLAKPTMTLRTGSSTPMTKGADGVWSYTSPQLEATTHLYFFNIDGLNIADPVNPVSKSRSRTTGSLVEVPGTPTPLWQLQNVPRGSVALNWQHSNVYNDEHQFAVYLPPGYDKGTQKYPVLYLVHGGGDVFISWTTAGNANIILDNLIAQKKAVPDDHRHAVPREGLSDDARAVRNRRLRRLHDQGTDPLRRQPLPHAHRPEEPRHGRAVRRRRGHVQRGPEAH